MPVFFHRTRQQPLLPPMGPKALPVMSSERLLALHVTVACRHLTVADPARNV